MGHLVGKDLYKRLGAKIDGLTMKAPWNEALYGILKELYTPEEAECIVKMPFGLSSLEKIKRVTHLEDTQLRRIVENLCSKGLVIDLWIDGQYLYMPSPIVVGIFEMTMMRTDPNSNYKTWARLFYEYMSANDEFYAANAAHGEKNSIMRALAHREAINGEDFVEVLDYETANSIVEGWDKFAIGYCSCRHEKQHVGEKSCAVPLETCSSFGMVADYLIRHAMAKEVSKSEMLDNISRSRDLRLVLTADNIKRQATFICHCCGCCCNLLLGVSKHGYPNFIVTTDYISRLDESKCTGCEQCSKACPIKAIEMVLDSELKTKTKKKPRVDESICLGCGVCALSCRTGAIRLTKRQKRVIYPETTFERVILQSLDRGTLQNQLFDNPGAISHKVMRGIIGGFTRLSPVKKAMMSNQLRSVFLASMRTGARLQGRGILTKM